jgi:hypothetical protein
MKRSQVWRGAAFVALALAVSLSFWQWPTPLRAQNGPPVITVSPDVPSDIPGGAPTASLQTAAAFAWQEFIALNWPAKAGVRDTADQSQKFGAPTTGPLVWHTYRAKNEIFPGGNSASLPPHGYTPTGGPNYGYDDPPKYIYNAAAVGSTDGQVQPCTGQAPVLQPAWINLDEVTQIGLDSMFAGVVPAASTTNSSPQLIRFMAKANRTHYNYIASHSYWYLGAPRTMATRNFTAAVRSGTFPPASPYISFPTGTIETKAAFRPLTPQEVQSKRFFSTRVRYYEQDANGTPCYREDTWGLIALHLIQKTPSAPAFVFATFEQADNLLTTVNGQTVPVEDVDGNVVNPSPTATSPALTYTDSPTNPQVSVNPSNAPFCNTSGRPQLYYQNISGQTGVPTGGSICVNQRDHAIPPPIVAVNQAAHAAIAAYSTANGIENSPWAYYKLVNVQAYPFNVTDIVADPNSPRNAATFYQANIVVETNYTLQNFSGRVAGNGAPTNYTNAGALYQQNAYVLNANGSLNKSYGMGGCMGCHAVAQSTQGGDFSFITTERPAGAPETPAQASSEEIKARYRALLGVDRTN